MQIFAEYTFYYRSLIDTNILQGFLYLPSAVFADFCLAAPLGIFHFLAGTFAVSLEKER